MNRTMQPGSSIAYGIFALSMTLCLNASSVSAQEDASLTAGSQENSLIGTRVQSLDDIRDMTAREKAMTRIGFELPVNAMQTTPKRQQALNKVRQIQASLAGEGDRSQIERALREALEEFFLADMQHRVEELDKIKRKVLETEATLQKRLEAKEESIDLQVKLLFQEADGISVFGSSASGTVNRSPVLAVGLPYDPEIPSGQPPIPARQ